MPDGRKSFADGFFSKLVDMGDNTHADQMVARDPGLARAIVGNTINRRTNTTAYTAGQLIGGSATGGFDGGGGATDANGFTFPNFARSPGGMVQLTSLRMFKSQATAAGTTEFLVFRGKPAFTIADAAAITTSGTGVSMGSALATSPRLIARFSLDWTQAVVFADGAELAVIPQRGFPAFGSALPDGTSLFGIHVARGSGYSPLSGEAFFPVLEGLAF